MIYLYFMRALWKGLGLWVGAFGVLFAQNFGIGISTPTERLHVAGNFRLDGAFMPGNDAGQVGWVLVSQGQNAPPVWQPGVVCGNAVSDRLLRWGGAPAQACHSTLAEAPSAPHHIWNADGGAAAPQAKLTIRAVGTATEAIHGYTTVPNARAIYGEAGGAQGIGVLGSTGAADGYGVAGINNATAGNAVGVGGATASPTGSGVGGLHFPNSGTGSGVTGLTNSPEGYGGYFSNLAPQGTGEGRGVQGVSAQFPGPGVHGYNIHPQGIGVAGLGENNSTYFHLAGYGAGGAFTASYWGVLGFATSSAGDFAGGGFFAGPPAPPNNIFPYYAYTAAYFGGTNYKIIGTGTVSTIISDRHGQRQRVLFAPEATEVLLMDQGEGQLQNGRAFIHLDPDFAHNIHVDDHHPLRVFIQLRDDCKGVYVTNESASGFEVRELQGGNSNARFFWQVLANRKDEYDPHTGRQLSRYQDLRMPEIMLSPRTEAHPALPGSPPSVPKP